VTRSVTEAGGEIPPAYSPKPSARICEGKAKWPSYSTTVHGDPGFLCNRKNALRQLLVSQPVYLDWLRILNLIGDGI
jgi:hypothetical protein